MKIVSSRDFNQDVSQAKRAARIEPVFITDRGRPTHVLMSIDAYRQMSGQTESIVDLLAMPAPAEAGPDDPPRSTTVWSRRGAAD
ncbi:type II toxin-antitoxin system Phd/YefM family antitoxin [Sphingomonas sp. PR090111-T3T-6A]|uniref:type II toxin-antitoxin system Phd/YefM family antitoxin n=1 Tax=Sphingomonas sp. PR090111-T3T-6A TaxID=685778 RepID=UPI00035E0722|nr:type II toxin-antitoxin system Phd/YefM family antitoxin [Sphingomonas sp. PR090111-T3T-6A]